MSEEILATAAPIKKQQLLGIPRQELAEIIAQLGEKPFRAKQLWHWIYTKGVQNFDEMSNISASLRQKLNENYTIKRPAISQNLISSDGTRKWLVKFEDGQEVETVYIPETDRGTLCVSSQVGCTLTCKFCHTGTQRLVRNLTPAEIVQQIMLAKDHLEDWPSTKDPRLLSNVVMMGMGEPLYNYDNVAQALKIVMDGEGIALSRRRITLSTSGVVPQIEQCGIELGINLAISLHAVTDEVRNRIMPINKKYPLELLIQACRNYQPAANSRRITFEYVMLDGVNDSEEDARKLVKLIKGIPAIVNLIPFNPWPGSFFTCSSSDAINRFAAIIIDAGYRAPIRTPRGEDILAACGQLKSESERQSKSQRLTSTSQSAVETTAA